MITRRLSGSVIEDLETAAALLRSGATVAFPTETVYGLGALALDPLAVRGIYAAKGRPATNPLIVHVLGKDEARALCADWPAEAERLAAALWPGPLTLVLPRAPAVPDEVTAGGPTVAVRAPAHPVARALLARVGAPLAAPSANRSEHVSPTTAAHVLRDLEGRIDAVLDGGQSPLGIESTVLQLGAGGPRLLRSGAIGRAQLEALLGRSIATSPEAGADGLSRAGGGPGDAATAASPGMQRRHYAPAAQVRLARRADLPAALHELRALSGPPRLGALLCGAPLSLPAEVCTLDLPANPAGYARGLYAALRELEDRGCAAIAIEQVPSGPEWEAIADRLRRASAAIE